MAERYDHRAIEKKWQERWVADATYATPDTAPGKENYYLLTEFPYPSGNLHVGHWYAFSVPDIFARYMRMRGYNVLYPIGFDAFGLPAENAAIKNKLNPREWTFGNIDYMRTQLRSMGASFDWSREVITADPAYYKWTQWLFLQFYNKGLVYRKETAVNWCPQDKTVLANEQVVDGHCERCGAEVEQRQMPQWNIKITEYADRLVDDLAGLDWPKQIKDAQINWIGRSEGAKIDFALSTGGTLTVFTTRPDTLFGATYMVIAPEHALAQASTDTAVQQYIAQAKKKTELERTENKQKTGVELAGVKAINPATNQEIPIYVADYVLGNYGTGAIMAVPAHDERDYEFAKQFNLPVVQVIEPVTMQTDGSSAFRPNEPFVDSHGVIVLLRHWAEDKYLGLKWRDASDWGTLLTGGIDEGMSGEDTARKEIVEETGYTDIKSLTQFTSIHSKYYHVPKKLNRFGHAPVFVAQLGSDARGDIAAEDVGRHEHHWLTPQELKNFLTAESHRLALDLLLGKVYTGPGLLTNSGEFDGLDNEEAKQKIVAKVGGQMTRQYRLRDWVVSRQRFWGVPIPMINCATCGYQPVPDTQLPVVLPDLEDYLPTGEGKSPLAKKREWVEVVCPKCQGPAERETDTLDTFVDSSWYFQRYTDNKNTDAFASPDKLKQWLPVDLYSGGSEHTTMHVLYSRFWHKAMYDLGLVADAEPYLRRLNRGLVMGPDGQKMSKSKGNVIDPDAVVQELGADTVRMYMAFMGPYNEVGAYPWTPGGAAGVRRFLEKVYKTISSPNSIQLHNLSPEVEAAQEMALHRTIKRVSESIQEIKFNTAVSDLMKFVNHNGLNRNEFTDTRRVREIFLQLLAPFAPHIAAELAEITGANLTVWPEYDSSKFEFALTTVAVQINGKSRTTIEIMNNAPESEALEKAIKAAAKWAGEDAPKKVVYVPGRIINLIW